MAHLRTVLQQPLMPFALLIVGYSAALLTSWLVTTDIPIQLQYLGESAMTLFLALGLIADARRRRVPTVPVPLLVLFLYPFSVAWYCIWSRGWRGWALLFALFGLWLVPYLILFVAEVARILIG